MIKKQNGNMNNLQVASTSLDVTPKIYGFRMDVVNMNTPKMIGVMGKQEKRNSKRDSGTDTENFNAGGNNDVAGEPSPRAKKKRKSKQKILATAESL